MVNFPLKKERNLPVKNMQNIGKNQNFWKANCTGQNADLLVEDFGFSGHVRCKIYIALYWSKFPFHTVLESKHYRLTDIQTTGQTCVYYRRLCRTIKLLPISTFLALSTLLEASLYMKQKICNACQKCNNHRCCIT